MVRFIIIDSSLTILKTCGKIYYIWWLPDNIKTCGKIYHIWWPHDNIKNMWLRFIIIDSSLTILKTCGKIYYIWLLLTTLKTCGKIYHIWFTCIFWIWIVIHLKNKYIFSINIYSVFHTIFSLLAVCRPYDLFIFIFVITVALLKPAES